MIYRFVLIVKFVEAVYNNNYLEENISEVSDIAHRLILCAVPHRVDKQEYWDQRNFTYKDRWSTIVCQVNI